MSEFPAASSSINSLATFGLPNPMGTPVLANGLPALLPELLPSMLPGYTGRTTLEIANPWQSNTPAPSAGTSQGFTLLSTEPTTSRTSTLTSSSLLTTTSQDSLLGLTSTSSLVGSTLDLIDPKLTIASVSNNSLLTAQSRLSGLVDGTGSAVASLTYRFDSRSLVPVAVKADGSFDQTFDWSGLGDGYHSLTVTAKDAAGNTTTTRLQVLLLLSPKPPSLNASLLRDTAVNGTTNADRITADSTIAGQVKPADYGLGIDLGLGSSLLGDVTGLVSLLANNHIVEFKAGFDGTPLAQFANVLSDVKSDGSFTFSQTRLNEIYGRTLPDGVHTLHLRTKDSCGGTQSFDLTFTLDTQLTPAPTLDLAPESDSGERGDRLTSQRVVTLTGQTEANATVVLAETGVTTTSDAEGKFSFNSVSLSSGANSFTTTATDIAGNTQSRTTTFYQFSPPTAITLSNATVPENSANGTVIGRLNSLDPDAGESHTYTLEADAEGRFQLVGDEIWVANGALLDFEQNATHQITVRSTDSEGLSYSQVLSIQVTNVNEAPGFASIPVTVAEQGTPYRYDIVATDLDMGEVLTITADALPDGLTLVDHGDGTASLYGTPTLGNYDVKLTVQDAAGLTAVQSFTLKAIVSLTEQQFFTVDRAVAVTIPQAPSILSFKITPAFDTTSTQFINDAVEVALIDEQGRSLVHTIGEGRNAFFNWTEGQDNELAAGTSYDAATGTVRLNLTGIAPGTKAKLVFRLVNDDQDTTTQVQIEDLVIGAAPAGTLPPTSGTGISPTTTSSPRFDFAQIEDVSASFKAEYHQTSLNAQSKLLYTDVAIRNTGSYSTNAPLLVAVKNISDPSVQVRQFDGFTPEGVPYYDFSHLVQGGKLDSNQLTAQQSLVFYNPNGVQFSYELVMLTHLNEAPEIQTEAVTEIIGGQVYRYDVNAIDRSGDTLTYQLLEAPEGMAIDPQTGVISWDTTDRPLGSYVVSVIVSDSRGGVDQQTFNVSVIAAPPNRPPVFTSTPVTDARVNQSYYYDVNATDADQNNLTYNLINPLRGMQIDPQSGIIRWTPGSDQVRTHDVKVVVTDGQGGIAYQSFKILVQQAVGNQAPLITSDPITKAYKNWEYTYPVKAIDPNGNPLSYTLVDAPQGMRINPTTGVISWDSTTAAVGQYPITVLVEDGQGGKETQQFMVQLLDTPVGEIRGQTWNDTNGNGLQEATESGLAGIAVYLDLNNNSVFDPSEPQQMTSVDHPDTIGIDETGTYRFSNLAPGNYTVRELTPRGYSQTYPDFTLSDTVIQNGSFEQGMSSIGQFVVLTPGSTAIDYWTITGVSVDYIGTYWTSSDGQRSAELDGTPGPGGVAQTFSTTPGQDYIVSFNLAGNPAGNLQGSPPIKQMRVQAAGQSADFSFDTSGRTLQNMGWKAYSWQFKSIATTTTLEFKSLTSVSNLFGAAIDNVAVREIIDDGHRVTLGAGKIVSNINFGNTALPEIGNVAPTIISEAPTTLTVGQLWRYETKAIDADADVLRYDLPVYPDGMAIDPTTGTLAWRPTAEQVGIYDIIVRVQDGKGGIDLQSFRVEVQPENRAPIFTSTLPADAYPQANKPFYYQAEAVDVNGDTLTYSLVSSSTVPSDAEVEIDQAFQSLSLIAGATQPNQIPEITSTPRYSARIDSIYLYRVEANDPDGDILSYSLDEGSVNKGMHIPNGILTWKPQATQSGEHTVTVSVSDGQQSATQTFTLTVGNQVVNHAPTITSTPNFVTNINREYQYNLTGTDPDGDVVLWTLDAAPEGMVIDPSSGALRWQPRADQVGSHEVSVRLVDSLGSYVGQSFTLQVNGTNLAPSIDSTPITSAVQGQSYTYNVVASDPENDVLTFRLGNKPEGMMIDSTGTIAWTPQADQLGDQAVEVFVTDGQGATSSQTFTLHVGDTATNRAPVITSVPKFLTATGTA